MTERNNRFLLTEMEQVKLLVKLTPEERKKEVRRQMYQELRAMEMERRKRVALEAIEKNKREREERERREEERMMKVAKEREEEERRANEQKALEEEKEQLLKQEKLRWQKVMLAEQPAKRPRCTISALKKEQQRRREEAERRKETLYNNWVGEQRTDPESVEEKPLPNSSVYLLFAAKEGSKPEEKTKAAKPNGTLKWLQKRLNVDYWVDKYQDHRERKSEKRQLKADKQYTQWVAFKNRNASQLSRQFDCYTAGFDISRNSILKSMF